MSFLPALEELDKDGAIQEAAERVDPETRASFLRKAGVGVGTVVAGGALAGGVPALARAQGPLLRGDIDILNFALTLEELEAAFYQQAILGGLRGNENEQLADFAKVVVNHETAHVRFLRRMLGTRAVAKPEFDFKGAADDPERFPDVAKALEETGVHAYLGQLTNVTSKRVLLPIGRILPVEARHAAWIRSLRPGDVPSPAAFEDPFTRPRIEQIVKHTGFIVPA